MSEKVPFLTLAKAQEIIQDVPTPFHVYDEKGIRENARRINKAFAWNKGFKEYFAVKALPNPSILEILREEGCGVDCSSLTELMLSDAIGFKGDEIMFSSNMTPVDDMRLAYRLGANINLDDATMVDFLERVAGVPETIFCRYNPGGKFQLGTSEEGFQVMDNPGDAKYGMTEEQMIDSFRRLAQKGAKHFGIHAFLASNTISNAYYPELAGILFQLAVRVAKAAGVHVSCINLSGGVGIPYRPDQNENDIAVIGEGVRKKFEEILVPAGMGDVRIFTEMGRFTTGPYGALVTTAIHEKHIYKEYIGVDACAANLMRPAMYGAYHHITVLGKQYAAHDHKYDVVGGLCENNDKFAIDRMLPKIDIGDILYIHDTGAHGASMGYNYNGKLRSAEVLLCEDGSHALIRRAETPRDYFATLDETPYWKKLSQD
jgi:diaminopimelate decarboxylase